MANYKKILMAVDLSDDSDKVAERALAIARNNDAELHVIHVIEPLSFAYGGDIPMDFSGIQDEIHQQAKLQLERFAEKHAIEGGCRHVVLGLEQVELAQARALGARTIDLHANRRSAFSARSGGGV